MAEFIITFRETLEAALIVGIVMTFLVKHGYTHLLKQVLYAIVAALAGSVFFARVLGQIQEFVGNTSYEKLFEAIMMYTTAGILLYMVVWMTKGHYNLYVPTETSSDKNFKKTIKQTLLDGVSNTVSSNAKRGVFWLIFFAILREGFETVLFLSSSINATGQFSHLGFWGGIIIASILGYLLFVLGKKISLQRFFNYSSVLLIVFAAGMATYGTHELEEFLVKQNYIAESSIVRVWNILEPQDIISPVQQKSWTYNESKDLRYHPRHDKGTYGVFAKGFLGYNSDPNILEPIVRILMMSLGFGLWIQARKENAG